MPHVEVCGGNGFELEKYLAEKAIASMGEKKSKPQKGEKRKASSVSQKVEVPSDILHPELFKHLVKWRYDKSREKLLPAYTILQQKALIGVANLLPTTKADLKVIPYLGDKSIEIMGMNFWRLSRNMVRRQANDKYF